MAIFTPEIEARLPEGYKSLVDGYGKYAADIATSRALPAIDGQKVVHRRILYTYFKNKIWDLCKSATACGKVLEYHPHSDASVYETTLTMVDSTEYTQIPFLHGKGNFSKVYFSDKDSSAASPRYTEQCLSENAKLLFGEMNGIEMQPTEDGHTQEPCLLPVCFPSILTTAQMGIAVGIACNIPSFNFNEVLELTIEYLKTGKVSRVIAPDFQTGGDYIINNKALQSIMLEGRGQIKLRGRWVVQDKDILITQIPYYTRISDIISKARELHGVASANDETDLYGMKIRVTCTSKSVTDQVVLELLRDTGLQCSVGANIGVVINNEPKYMGVIDVIKHWCEFRRGVLKKQYTYDLENVRSAMRAPKALVELISNQELKNRFLDAMKESHIAAERVLREGLPDVDEDVIDYILDLKMRQFADCEARKRQYQTLKDRESQLITYLNDIDRVIIKQLTELNNTHKIPRKTLPVTKDYDFEALDGVEVTAQTIANYSVYVQVKGLYIRKLRYASNTADYIQCNNCDVISILDNRGRLLRVALHTIPDTVGDGVGTFLPLALGIDKDFQVVDYALIADKKIHYFYNDGYASTLDLSEWLNMKRVTRVTENGLAPKHMDKLRCILPDSGEYSHILVVTKKRALGIFGLNFAERARTARTKLITIPNDDEIWFIAPMNQAEAWSLLTGDVDKYYSKCCPVSSSVTVNQKLFSNIIERRV